MEEIFQVKLSSRDLLVLAALLGYESVFGVQDTAFLSDAPEMKRSIRQSVRRLERKKYICYDLDGTLYIQPALRQAISCAAQPDAVGLFTTNLNSGKLASVYTLCKEGAVATLLYAGEKKYQLQLWKAIPFDQLLPLPLCRGEACTIRERMLYEEAAYVADQFASFQQDEALERLQKHLQDPAALKTVSGILSGGCGYLRTQIRKRSGNLYRTVFQCLWTVAENHTVSLVADENNVLCFDAVDPEAVKAQIRTHMGAN